MKKLISIVLCMAMLMSCFALFASAVDVEVDPKATLVEAPLIDGVVGENEYTSSKFYPTNKFNTNQAGATITEYASYDDDYIYIALVYNTHMSSIDIRMNGKSTARTDMLQAEHIYYFNATNLANVDEQKIVGSRGNFLTSFAENEYEGIAKKNKSKNGSTIISTTFELKISRDAMRRVFEVENADFIGYYANGTAVANGSLAAGVVTNATQLNGVTALGWEKGSYSTATEAMAQSYGTTASSYTSKWRLLNFIMFGYEEPEVHNRYTPVGSADRAETLDLSDLVCLSALPSNYVSTKLGMAKPVIPTTDGVVKTGEYTNKKVYDAAHCSNATDLGHTVTEYVSQDDYYVYIALVYSQNVTDVSIRMNATSTVRTTHTGVGVVSQFDFKLVTLDGSNITEYIDSAGATSSKGGFSRGFTAQEYSAQAKRNMVGEAFANVTAELKISKEAIKDIFGVDSVDHIAYYAVAGKVVDDTRNGDITNAARMTNAGLTYCGFEGQSSNLAAAYPAFSADNYGSRDGWRLWNFIVFDEAPATYNYYCPESYEVPEGLTRATEFDFADISALGCLPANYVSTMLKVPEIEPEIVSGTAPLIDGVVNEGEYSSVKVYETGYTNRGDANVFVTEYVSQDADYIYFALVYNAEMKSIDIRMNGTADVRYDLPPTESISYFTYTLNTNEETTVAASKGNFTAFNSGEFEGVAKKNKAGSTVVNTAAELRISKEAMKRVYGVDSVDYFGYYGESKTVADATITNAARFTNAALTACGWKNSSSAMATAYGLDISKYSSVWRVMNIVVLNGETLSETVPLYCPADSCSVEGHEERRATIFDIADMRCLDLLPANFCATQLEEQQPVIPTTDGVVKTGEYTNKKVYDAAHCSNPTNLGHTVTEYVSQDDYYVYIALVYSQNVTDVSIRMNATSTVRTTHTGVGVVSQFDFKLVTLDGSNIIEYIDSAGATSSKGSFSRGFTAQEYSAQAKRNMVGEAFANVTAELKISKEAIKDIFGVDAVDHIAYYAVAGKVVAAAEGAEYDTTSGDITNAARLTNAGLTYCGFGTSSANLKAAYPAFDADNYGSRDGWRLWNFIVFDEAPATYNYYCPESYEVPEGLTRATELDFADMSALGCLPANYVSTELVNPNPPVEPEDPIEPPVEPEDPTTPPEPSSTPVKGTYVEGASAVDTYSVEITFGSMQFTYRDFDKAWDTSNHVETDVAGTNGWSCDTDANKITVTNHSNVAVKATLSYAQESGKTTVSASFGNNATLNLDSAVGTTYAEAPTASAYLTLSGTYSGNAEYVKVGTVTVTIAKQQ